MIIPEQKPFLTPGKLATLVTSTLTLGMIAMIGLALAALIFVCYLLTLAVHAIQEVSTTFTIFYSHADSITRLATWCIALLFLYKITPHIARFARPATLTR